MSTLDSKTCPHGHPLRFVLRDGWTYGVPNNCDLCVESGWTTTGYKIVNADEKDGS